MATKDQLIAQLAELEGIDTETKVLGGTIKEVGRLYRNRYSGPSDKELDAIRRVLIQAGERFGIFLG